MDKNLLQLFLNITSKEHVKWKFYFTCQTSFKVDESPILSSSSCVGYSPFNFHQFLELQNKFHQISRTTLKLIHFQKFVRTFFLLSIWQTRNFLQNCSHSNYRDVYKFVIRDGKVHTIVDLSYFTHRTKYH